MVGASRCGWGGEAEAKEELKEDGQWRRVHLAVASIQAAPKVLRYARICTAAVRRKKLTLVRGGGWVRGREEQREKSDSKTMKVRERLRMARRQ